MDREEKMDDVSQTKNAFKSKWENNQKLGHEDIFDLESEITQWILRRNGWDDFESLASFLRTNKTILDAGCGNGRVTALFSKLAPESKITGFDINPEIAQRNLELNQNISIEYQDLMLANGKRFDFIYSQEVLHHVADPVRAFNHLVDSLSDNGKIAIYVYKKKAPIREFTDEYLREMVSELGYEDTLKFMSQVTNFGKTLSRIENEIEIDSVDLLEIPAGSYTVQRLFYHFFFKCFWNPGLTQDENDAINFDWYAPQIASKHNLVEVSKWFTDRGLHITHQFEDEYGITMHGTWE